MGKEIIALYQASVQEQQAGVNRRAALRILKSEEIAAMTMSQFIGDVRESEVWAGAGGIAEMPVPEFGAAVGTKKKPQISDRALLDKRISEEVGGKRGEWVSGGQIAQAVKDVPGATAQAVAARLRVLVREGRVQKNGEGASRKYASSVAVTSRQGRAEKMNVEGSASSGADAAARQKS